MTFTPHSLRRPRAPYSFRIKKVSRFWQNPTLVDKALPYLGNPRRSAVIPLQSRGGRRQTRVQSFWRVVWKKAKAFTTAFTADLLKATLTLVGLSVFYGFIRLMALMGYSEEKLQRFEEVHYWGSYVALAVLTFQFLIRLVMSAFKEGD
jgi:hypothetical protein